MLNNIFLNQCEYCLTAYITPTGTCSISYEGSVNVENLIGLEADVNTEKDCKNLCFSNDFCSSYTYYDDEHATHKHLYMLLTSIKNPVKKCENCQSGPDRCDAFEACRFGLWSNGKEISAENCLLVKESKTLNYLSGEDGCFKTIIAVAIGSGGHGSTRSEKCTGGSGGGCGYINSIEFVLPMNKSITVEMNPNGIDTSLTLEGEIILSAANGLAHICQNGGDGYSGGGDESVSSTVNAGDGGTAGGDGEVGSSSKEGGKGSGFDISSIVMTHYQLSPGKGGENQGMFGGGGGGVLLDRIGPDTASLDGNGEGYGGGGVGGTTTSGLPGCLIFEILD